MGAEFYQNGKLVFTLKNGEVFSGRSVGKDWLEITAIPEGFSLKYPARIIASNRGVFGIPNDEGIIIRATQLFDGILVRAVKDSELQ